MNAPLDLKVYNQLKVIANKLMSTERANHTMSATDLVHEAFIKAEPFAEQEAADSDQYVFILARQMRRLLVDYGRQYSALKRGGDQQRTHFTESLEINGNILTDFSLISDAIDDLATLYERAAKAIDLFYFTNIDKLKAAEILKVSVPTLERDIKFAKAQITHYITSQN